MPDILVQTWPLWDHLKTLLGADATLQALLGAAGRVYLVTDSYGGREGPEDAPWGRLVIVPTDTLWPTEHAPSKPRQVGFLVRAEGHKPEHLDAYNVARALEAVHSRVYALLQGHAPASAALARTMVALPIYLEEAPQPVPLWDEARRVYYSSAEYRTELAPRPAA